MTLLKYDFPQWIEIFISKEFHLFSYNEKIVYRKLKVSFMMKNEEKGGKENEDEKLLIEPDETLFS